MVLQGSWSRLFVGMGGGSKVGFVFWLVMMMDVDVVHRDGRGGRKEGRNGGRKEVRESITGMGTGMNHVLLCFCMTAEGRVRWIWGRLSE